MNTRFVLLVAVGAFLLCGSLFAQSGSGDIVVESVTGIARYQTSAGRFESLSVNQKISRDTVINTGINSSLVLRVGGETVTIRAMQRGTVAGLTAVGTTARPGITLGANVVESEESSARARSNVSTASTRAADVAEDIDWAEDVDE